MRQRVRRWLSILLAHACEMGSEGHAHLQPAGLSGPLGRWPTATATSTASTAAAATLTAAATTLTTAAATATCRARGTDPGGPDGGLAALLASVLLHVPVLAVLAHQDAAAAEVSAVLGVDGHQGL